MAYVAPLSNAVATSDAERQARVDRRLGASPLLAAPLRRLGYDSRELWAWDNYHASVLGFAGHCRAAGRHESGIVRALEIGGGRGAADDPAGSRKRRASPIRSTTSTRANSLWARRNSRRCSLISPGRSILRCAGRYDLVISRMVMEHVRDAARAWSNMFELLAPGGVALAFHPTLYAPPFVINWLAPEALTAPVLRLFFSDRHDGDTPKFPARYDLCTTDPNVIEPALRRAGFRHALSAPFWGDRYFRHLPGVRGGQRRLERAR